MHRRTPHLKSPKYVFRNCVGVTLGWAKPKGTNASSAGKRGEEREGQQENSWIWGELKGFEKPIGVGGPS